MKRWDFDSLADFARACDALPADIKRRFSDESWTGETFSESLRLASSGGTEAHVPAAEAMLSQIHASLPETAARRWVLDHAGAFPCVPAYLAGEPENMWAAADMPADTSPVRIFVCSTSSAGVSHHDLQRRGCAALALVMLASRTRPVELYSYAHVAEIGRGVGDAVIVQRLQSHPLMLSEVAYVLTSAGWARNLTYAVLAHRGASLHWGGATKRDGYQAGSATRSLLALEPQDVLIGPARLYDPAVSDPVGFVHRELARLNLAT